MHLALFDCIAVHHSFKNTYSRRLFEMRLLLYFLIYQQARAIVKHNIVSVHFDDEITGEFDGQCEGKCTQLLEAEKYLNETVCQEKVFKGT